MNRLELILRTRSLVRDLSNSFFRETDVIDYLNEGIERVGQVIPELSTMPLLLNREAPVLHLPRQYHHLLALYSASKLCTQDERHYQSGTFMNEFETKLGLLAQEVINGDITITDENGIPIDMKRMNDHVVNEYFFVDGFVRPHREYKPTLLSIEETVGD